MFAVKGNSWRTISSELDLLPGETLSQTEPAVVYETMLSPSQQIILADGNDVAKVTITGEPGATVEYTVNGEPFSTDLNASGSDTIELTSDTSNTTIVVQAGTAKAVIYAVEVPARRPQ